MTAEQLEVYPWIVELEPEKRAIFAQLRETETKWLRNLEKRGCQLIRCHESKARNHLVAVPESIAPFIRFPDLDLYHHWRAILKHAAHEQKKRAGVGDRSATPPGWIQHGGGIEQRWPGYVATGITWRRQQAARGATMTPEECLEYLNGRWEALTKYIENSRRKGQYDRLKRQEAALDEIIEDITQLEAILKTAKSVGVQLKSGEKFVARIKERDGNAFTTTITTIGLVSIAADATIAQAKQRRRRESGGRRIVLNRIIITIYDS